MNISGWLQSCQQFRSELEHKISEYSRGTAAETQGGASLCPPGGAFSYQRAPSFLNPSDCIIYFILFFPERCMDVYTELTLNTNPASSRAQCSSDEALRSPQRRPVARLVEILLNKYGERETQTQRLFKTGLHFKYDFPTFAFKISSTSKH